ncbi:MAG: hypothetical protein JXM68_07040 [Sedimentisphaerales bacterium]|nr:hypothetical protein [Sedimentisphaerales bacterium]
MEEQKDTVNIDSNFLTEEEQKIWDFYYPKIKQNLQEVDSHIVSMFCIVYAKYRHDIRDPEKTSIEIERLFSQIMKLSAKLGLSPFDRKKMEITNDDDDEDDSLFQYIGKK